MTNATIKSGTINLLNTIIGAGILAMPYGLKSNGFLFGSFLIIWSSLTSAFGLYLQNKVAKYTKQQGNVSYFSLAQLTYPHLSIIFDLAISIKCFGVGVSYLVVIGDLMPKIMLNVRIIDGSIFMHRNFWITVFLFFIIVPLSYLKKIDSLKYTSVIALFSVVYLICLVFKNYILHNFAVENKVINWTGPPSLKSTLSSFPIFIFAYTCHQNMFAIINEIKSSETSGSQTKQCNLVIRNAISMACVSYLIVGICGYLTFGNSVNGNIITMYPTDSILSSIGRLCIVVMASLSYPLQCHPCRSSINHIVYFFNKGIQSCNLKNNYSIVDINIEADVFTDLLLDDDSSVSRTFLESDEDTNKDDPITVPLTIKNFYIITTAINILSYTLAMSVKSLEHILAFVGSTGSTSISFILPGLFGFLLVKPLDRSNKLNQIDILSKFGGLALAVWGIIVMFVCLCATLLFGATH